MSGEINGVALSSIAIGGMFVYGGITGKSPLQTMQAIVQGKAPTTVTQSQGLVAPTATDTTSAGVGAAIPNVSGGSGWQPIASFLEAKGLPKPAVAGILGNLQVESGFNPGSTNPGEGAIGIAQWEGGRRANLQAYAALHGGTESDLNTQLGFLWQELTGSYSYVYFSLKIATSATEAATIWDAQYERSAGTTRAQRIANANKIYGML